MANKKRHLIETENAKNAYFLSLELENVRCFGERQWINFSNESDSPKQWTLILGDNGTGKTTILQSLVSVLPFEKEDEGIIYLVPRILSNSHNWDKLIKENIEKTTSRSDQSLRKVVLSPVFSIQKKLRIEIDKKEFKVEMNKFSKINIYENKFVSQYPSNSFHNVSMKCFPYGASRKAGLTSLSEQSDDDFYYNIFLEKTVLINPEEWLLQVDYVAGKVSPFQKKAKKFLKQIEETLILILPDVDNIRFAEKDILNKRIPQPIVEFHTPYGWVDAKDLSLGYRTSMAWMVDFAARMFDLYPESENPLAEPAVVLIDEIDLHLHPKWQRDLLDWLSDLCPNTQFIVTTHSPLIVQAGIARDANFAVCRREGDHVVIDQSIEAVKGWRADQILASDFFDIPKRDNQTEKDLERRKELIIKSKLTKAEQKELAELNKKVESLPVSENLEDDKAMEIIRKAANYIKENGATVK
jgi:predicted ATP-binding protein involved in virulence